MFPGQDISKLSLREFLAGMKAYGKTIDPDPSKRTFEGLVRGEDGSFNDEDLVNILKAANNDPVGTLRKLDEYLLITQD